MKVATNLSAFLSLAYALPLWSTSENAIPLETDNLDLFASNIGLGDISDITFPEANSAGTLYDPLASSSDPQNLFDGPWSSTGVPGSTDQLCSNDCPYLDFSTVPLGLDPDYGNAFGADLGSDGIFIPFDDLAERGSGREANKDLISLIPEDSEWERGSGREKPDIDENGLGNDDIFFSADDGTPISDAFDFSLFN